MMGPSVQGVDHPVSCVLAVTYVRGSSCWLLAPGLQFLSRGGGTLPRVLESLPRVLTRSRKYYHITKMLRSLHWLHIKFCISYKIVILTYKALNGLAPEYLTNILSRYNPTHSLRSQNSGLLVVPRIAKSTKGGRTFLYLAPKIWNCHNENRK